MPAARRGTVTEDITGAIKSISGTLEWKGDKEGVVRLPIGRVRHFPFRCAWYGPNLVSLKVHYTTDELEKNISAFLTHLGEATTTKDDIFDKKKCEYLYSCSTDLQY